MNMLFGLIPALSIIVILIWLWVRNVIKAKTLCITTMTVLLITAFFSAQTYGPRNELSNTAIPEPPEKSDVESGKKLVDHKDRSKTFTDQIGR